MTFTVLVKDPCQGIKITSSLINYTNYTIGSGELIITFKGWGVSTDLCGNLTYSASS